MTDLFDKLVDGVVSREGGYVDHPSDRGGPTIWGVTQETARRYGYTGDMRAMPRSTAVAIYKTRYFIEPGFDKIAALSVKIGEELFDTGVNMGPKVAGEFLQYALNALNRQQKDYPDIKVDGDVGPTTVRTTKAFLDLRGKEGEKVLLKALDAQQGARYLQISQSRPANEDFVFGWIAHRLGSL
jgi:lysozyme family protein